MAWGGSIGQVAQNEIALSAQQRAAAERNLEMLIRQMESQKDNQRQDRQLNQRDSQSAEQRRQFDAQLEAQKAHEGRLQTYNDANLGLQKDRLREEQRTRRMQLLDRRRQFTFDDQQKNLRNLLPSAEEMANNGMFENTEDVIKQFPSLAGQAPMLSSRSQAARKMIEAELQSDQQNAALLNEGPAQVGRLRNMVTQEQDASWDTDRNHWYRPNQADTGAIAEWGQEATALQGAMDATRRDKSRMQRLAPDAQGRFAPTTVLPWTPRTSGTPQQLQPAPQDPAQRQRGAVYQTPRGPLTWTGTGWVQQ